MISLLTSFKFIKVIKSEKFKNLYDISKSNFAGNPDQNSFDIIKKLLKQKIFMKSVLLHSEW